MRYPTLILLLFALTVFCCNKHDEKQTDAICEHPNQLPSYGYLYSDPFVVVNYEKNHCGYFPLSKKNYWVYLDSLFDNNGQFLNTAVDTMRFTKTHQGLDGLIWWEPNIYRGITQYVYSTDSLVYVLSGNWTGRTRAIWFYPIVGDSIIESTSYSDHGIISKVYKIKTNIVVPAGAFSDCILYKKSLVTGADLDMLFKPGVGILRYKEYDPDSPKIFKISTLINYHLE